mmetsp:Transcript_129649/g.307544  ORF Transcript_129649/g.307544 Transcript_129649/m.307544 type:complete len:264 (-) Transcript_129649:343-1134(-)
MIAAAGSIRGSTSAANAVDGGLHPQVALHEPLHVRGHHHHRRIHLGLLSLRGFALAGRGRIELEGHVVHPAPDRAAEVPRGLSAFAFGTGALLHGRQEAPSNCPPGLARPAGLLHASRPLGVVHQDLHHALFGSELVAVVEDLHLWFPLSLVRYAWHARALRQRGVQGHRGAGARIRAGFVEIAALGLGASLRLRRRLLAIQSHASRLATGAISWLFAGLGSVPLKDVVLQRRHLRKGFHQKHRLQGLCKLLPAARAIATDAA